MGRQAGVSRRLCVCGRPWSTGALPFLTAGGGVEERIDHVALSGPWCSNGPVRVDSGVQQGDSVGAGLLGLP